MTAPPAGALAKALAKAQERAKAVPHDATNAFHRYAYTSAEAVIAEAKQALAGCGLAIIPVSHTLVQTDGRLDLHRQLVLTHESGEERSLAIVWPVVPDKGRPVDKAVAGALTTSLSYCLRDLLLMPRVDPGDDLAAREDRPEPQALNKSAPPPQKPAGPPPEPLEVRLAKKEAKLVEEGLVTPGSLLAYLADMLPNEGLSRNLSEIHQEHFGIVGGLVKKFEAEARAAATAEIPI